VALLAVFALGGVFRSRNVAMENRRSRLRVTVRVYQERPRRNDNTTSGLASVAHDLPLLHCGCFTSNKRSIKESLTNAWNRPGGNA
jgi:hypothetical protein